MPHSQTQGTPIISKKANGIRRMPDTPDSKLQKPAKPADSVKKLDSARKPHASRLPSMYKMSDGPGRQYTHWDYVLMEMKWLAADFIQVREA